jgi:RNA polymerase sigma-70 factor (ECF subfamily)
MKQKGIITYENNDEQGLWKQFLLGNKDAFAFIYNRYADALAAYGYRISNDLPIVKDAIQDLFIELWRSKNNLSPVHSVKAYLFKALRYKLLRYGRLNLLYTSDDRLGDILTDDFSVETKISNREEEYELAEKIAIAIKKLSKRQQEAITLKFYHGFSNEQIAEIMSINCQSAANILHRALLALRNHFSLPIILLYSSLMFTS